MKILQVKAYNFEDLSETAKKKAIEEYKKNDMAWTEEDSNELSFSFEEKLHEYGFEDGTNVDFSLNHSQGDGVAFYGSVDAEHWLENHKDKFTQKELKRLLWVIEEFGIRIGTITNSLSSRYSHAHTMICYCEIDGELQNERDSKLIKDAIEKMSKIFESEVVNLSRELEKLGYDTIDDKEKDETIIESIKESSFLFNEDGTFLNIDGRYFYVQQ